MIRLDEARPHCTATSASDRVIGGVAQGATWRGYGREGRAGRLVGRPGRKKRTQDNGAAFLAILRDEG